MNDLRQGVTIEGAPVPLRIQALTPRLLRLHLGERAQNSPTSYLPARDRAPVGVKNTAGWPMRIDTGELVIEIARDPWWLSLCGRDGTVRAQVPLEAVVLGPRLRLRIEASEGQHYYGLGEGGLAFDRLGVTRRLWNHHVNHGPGAQISIPLLLSHLGYGLFLDCSSDGEIAPGDASGSIEIAFDSDEPGLDLYFLGGADLRETLAAAADLLGHAALPPRWALGFLQSTRHFESEDEIRDLAATLRAKQLPCDGLIFLSTYGDQRGWNRGVGYLDVEPSLLPRPEQTLAAVRAQHFHLTTHEYPVVHGRSALHAEAKANGYLLDAGYADIKPTDPTVVNYKEGQRYIDFSKPEARAWWWERHRDLVRLGVEGWWLDGGEGPPPETELHGGTGAALHNRYDLLRQQCFAEGEAKDRPNGRPFLLCRSGGTGMQRFGAACWSGDINNTFTTLEAQVPIGLNMGMSGVPLWGTDIGGFYSLAPPGGELFARWFQFGAFCPVFRAHGRQWRQHLPWSHGPEIEAICQRYLELRYRLMPYTYTLAWQAHAQGLPMMRPLVLNYPDDPRVWELGSQYLWGDDLLVAPVTRAGTTHWPVYVPAGRWRDFWTHAAHEGPAGISVEAPLNRLPLLARAGAILPMAPAMQHQEPGAWKELTVLVYPEGRSSFTLYEDDGATSDYRNGRYARTELRCEAEPSSITISVGAPEGDATLIPDGRPIAFKIFAPPPRGVELMGKGALPRVTEGSGPGWWHDGHFLHIRLADQPLTVRSSEKLPWKTFSVAPARAFVERSPAMRTRPARSQARKLPATIWDVAHAAGVSVGTVSKALNGRGQLREETRTLVRSAAERLGFRPNDLAQSLLRKRSFTVGLISTDAYGRFSIPVLEGIESALEPARISVFLCSAADNPAREQQHIDSLMAKRVDGIIVTGRRTDKRAPLALGNAAVPVLYAFAQVAERNALCLLPDDFGGAALAGRHLTGLGRKRIAHVTGPEDFEAVRQRRDGFRRALKEHGHAWRQERVLVGQWSEAWGREAAARLLALSERVDAIFCGSDQIARGVVDGLRDRGVGVPDDIAVVGFDNWEIIAAATRPPLTTIDMNLRELGRQAGLRLLALIDGESDSGVVRLPCRLVVRQSCGATGSSTRGST